jgi:uncharacterized protein YfiM (DUF2279 family)
MNQSFVHSSTSLASHAGTFKSFLSCCLLTISSFSLVAQDTVLKVKPGTKLLVATTLPSNGMGTKNINSNTVINALTPEQVKSRVRIVATANVAGYAAILVGLNAAWYADYPRGGFHFFNDNNEWLQADKAGHLYSSYIESYGSMELWRWTGIDRKKRIWYGGLSGVAYQTIIEILDGFSTQWGWSWGDFSANVLGSATLISQELAWDDQRIRLKFSFHKNNYGDPGLNKRANELFGKTLAERLIKDYNAQTYWASVNLHSFFPKSNLPPWLALAVGYSADGMFGARDNVAIDKNGVIYFNRQDIKRYRQWYLSPDIDFTKIKTKKKGVRTLFKVLSAFKFPAPSLEFSNGKFKVNVLHF